MKTKLTRLFAVLLLLFGLTACPDTTVDEDFGLKPAVLKPEGWNGKWVPVDDDDLITFTVMDAAMGVVRMTEDDGKDKEKAKPSEMLVRLVTDAKTPLRFATYREVGEKKEPLPLYLLRERDDGVLIVWSIDHAAVEKAIKAGQLKGTTKRVKDDPQNHLDSDAANYGKLLEPQFWNWTEPMCLRRVKAGG